MRYGWEVDGCARTVRACGAGAHAASHSGHAGAVWEDVPVIPGILTRRLCGATLLAQAICVFFGALVAWGLAEVESDPRATTYLWGGIGLAVLCVVAAGALRGPAGVPLGWLAQLLTLASAIVLPAMLFVAVIFGGLWLLCLTQGRRMDKITAQRDAEARAHGAGEGS